MRRTLLPNRPGDTLAHIGVGALPSRPGENTMTTENAVRALAGTFVLVTLALGALVSSGFLWLTAFVGVNLLQSAFTGFCPAAILLRKLGTRDAHAAQPGA
jgi:hypothetical protein